MILHMSTRRPRLVAYAAILLFFGLGGYWAAAFPLAGAAIAPGVVSPEGRRITVQHLEGGVIAKLLVEEGQEVSKGSPLAVIADIRSRTETSALAVQLASLRVEEAVWVAEELGEDRFIVPSALDRLPPAEIRRIVTSARRLQQQKRETRLAETTIIAGRQEEVRQRVNGLEARSASLSRQLVILRQELEATKTLFEKGLTPRSRLAALQREEARLEGDIGQAESQKSILAEQLENLDREIGAIASRAREEASERLVDVRRRINATETQLEQSVDALARTEIQAPADGVVLQMRIATPGGVLAPGEPLLDLVPTDGKLVIEARVKPGDIDDVRTGQMARVVLSAYQQRNLTPLLGTVRQVSADRIMDENTGEFYFQAVIDVPDEELQAASNKSNQNIQLLAGMPAQVMIVTADRTMASYLFSPFMDSLRRSFRES